MPEVSRDTRARSNGNAGPRRTDNPSQMAALVDLGYRTTGRSRDPIPPNHRPREQPPVEQTPSVPVTPSFTPRAFNVMDLLSEGIQMTRPINTPPPPPIDSSNPDQPADFLEVPQEATIISLNFRHPYIPSRLIRNLIGEIHNRIYIAPALPIDINEFPQEQELWTTVLTTAVEWSETCGPIFVLRMWRWSGFETPFEDLLIEKYIGRYALSNEMNTVSLSLYL